MSLLSELKSFMTALKLYPKWESYYGVVTKDSDHSYTIKNNGKLKSLVWWMFAKDLQGIQRSRLEQIAGHGQLTLLEVWYRVQWLEQSR